MKEELIIAYLGNECSPAERDMVEAWINDAQANKKHFNKLKFIWENSESDLSQVRVNTGSSWMRIEESISKAGYIGSKRPSMSARTFMRLAASVILLIGIGYFSARLVSSGRTTSSELVTVETTSEISEVELPDGSRVWLNNNTMISYPEKFKSDFREINLRGEAFFEVKKNKRKSFIVENDYARIEVLGTSFNVNSGNPGSKVVVSVVTGRVAFSNIYGRVNNIILEQGEQGSLSLPEGSLSKTENTNKNFLAWKTGILVFENNPLTEVCDILNKHYHQVIRADSLEMLNSKMLTATFNNKDLEDVVSIIAMTLDVSIRYEGEQIILAPKN
ncbi:FecR family protein [Bacteroidota bacterium]